MKSQKKSQTVQYGCDCPRKYKIMGAFALLALFVCGFLAGFGIRADMAKKQMQNMMEQVPAENQPLEACVMIEKLLSERTYPIDSQEYIEHISNATTYQMIAEKGCPENSEKYIAMANKELEIANALKEGREKQDALFYGEKIEMTPCMEIERLLERDIQASSNYRDRLNNAYVYSTLAEKGCTENSEEYKQKALGEIEIATALIPEEALDEDDAVIVIDTYKKLDMQKEAQAFLNKLQKLTDPAIDFILQMEKVINEEF